MKTKNCLVICSLLVSLASACASQVGNREHIAYLAGTQWQGGQIYLMDTDGSDQGLLRTGLVDDGCPIWSPDGSKLLFVSANGTYDSSERELNLYVIDKDGKNLIQLTHGPGDVYSAAWSPDGNQIVFAGGQDRGHRPVNLYIMDVDGSHIRQITFTAPVASDIHPSWSPDGASIVFSSNPPVRQREENPGYSLFVLSLATGEVKQITFEHEGESHQHLGADWSPNGETIVFYTSDNLLPGSSRLNLWDSERNEVSQIPTANETWLDVSPKWSPDGRSIVLSSSRDEIALNTPRGFDIYTMNTDGTEARRLTTTGNNYCPDWQLSEP